MKRLISHVIAIISISINAMAQNVYVLNTHSQLEPMNPAYTLGTKLTKRIPPGYSLVVDGKESDISIPLGAIYFYVIPPENVNIRSYKLVPLKKGKKNTRLLPYLKSKVSFNNAVQSVKSSTSNFSLNFGNNGNGRNSGNVNLSNEVDGYMFEQFVELDDVSLRYEQISDRLYKIYPNGKMKAGEYAFIRMGTDEPAEVYDLNADKSLSDKLIVPKDEAVLAELGPTDESIKDKMPAKNSLIAGTRSHLSDVDTDIPTTKKVAEKTFALIISNEDYKRAESVPFANNDGNVFEKYLQLAIGVPQNHITHLQNASLSDIKYGLNHIKEVSEAFDGEAKIIVYYSGHGIPDEKNKDGYLLPVDGYASDPSTAYKLSVFYKNLNDINSKNVVLFLDACFSGAQKSGSMIASARGVAIKVNEDKPQGNLVVISAAQGDQTAYPYAEKEHGMMTYFLLKKLQETTGDVTLGELSDYITTQVKRTSLIENGKSQIPVTSFDDRNTTWSTQTLR